MLTLSKIDTAVCTQTNCLISCRVPRYSAIDLQSAYYKVRLKPEVVPTSAFITPHGLYEFRGLCFGLANAPCTSQSTSRATCSETSLESSCLNTLMTSLSARVKKSPMSTWRLSCSCFGSMSCMLIKGYFMQPELHFLGRVVSATGHL